MNLDPYGTFVPSAMVTSCSSTALSLQLAGAVALTVAAVAAVGAGVVAWANGVPVGLSVTVTNTGVLPAGVGIPMETQEPER